MTRNRPKKPFAVAALLLVLMPQAARAAVVPHLELQHLDGTPFLLPADAIGSVTVLVVGFTQAAGTKSGPWVTRLESQFGANPSCTIHSVAILAGVPALFRGFVHAAVERNVSPSERATFLLTYHNDAEWKMLVGFSEPNNPYVVVIDRQGGIALALHGSMSDPRYGQVAAEIVKLLSQTKG